MFLLYPTITLMILSIIGAAFYFAASGVPALFAGYVDTNMFLAGALALLLLGIRAAGTQ